MKKKLLLLFFLLALLSVGKVYAQNYQFTDPVTGLIFRFKINDDLTTATILKAFPKIGGHQLTGNIVIPPTVKIDGGDGTTYIVTTIGSNAFWRERYFEGLSLPPSVTTIEESAFSLAQGLSTISMPGVVTIGGSAFAGCTNLRGPLSMPNVTSIGVGAFSGCYDFNGPVSMPKVTTIGKGAFVSCNKIQIDLNLPDLITIGENAFYDCRELVGPLSMPKVTTIGKSAFYQCYKLTGDPTFPELTSIGEWAFYKCGELEGILSMPKVTTIEETTFYRCRKLTQLNLPEVTTIEQSAFYECKGLRGAISLPKAVTIGKEAFNECTNLGILSLPVATSVLENAFNRCYALTQASLPSLTIIENGLFLGCYNLKDLTFSPYLTTIRRFAFNACESLTEVAFPNSTTLEEGAFFGCKRLTRASFPNATTIGEKAFYGCEKLTQIEMPKVEIIRDEAFTGCAFEGDFVVPASIKEIGQDAFINCQKIESFKIEDGAVLTKLGTSILNGNLNIKYVDMHGTTVPSDITINRRGGGPFSGLKYYTMIYLPSGCPAPENGESNIVIGNTCNIFYVYDKDNNYKRGRVGCEYPILYPFTAIRAEYDRQFTYYNCKTVCLPYPATVPDGMRAYELTRRSSTWRESFIFTPITSNQLEANKPYLIRTVDNNWYKSFGRDNNVQVLVTPATIEVPASEDGTVFFGGTTTNIENAKAAAGGYYNLVNNQWTPIQTSNPNGYVHSFRAYVRATSGGAPAKGFALVLDEEDQTTSINSAEQEIETDSGKIYTLDGKCVGMDVNALKSGEIYIKNGKKFYKF